METTRAHSLRSFFTIWIGQAVSLFGSQLVQFVLIWWLTEKTGSATVLALASLVGLLPQVLLGPFIGALVDRWNRRHIMLAADSAVAGATIALALLFLFESVQVWHVFSILLVRALAGGFHFPAMMASTTLMVPEKQLTRIQGLNQTLQGGLTIVSAPLGALLLSALPMQLILVIDVGTALVAIVPLFLIDVPQPQNGAMNADTTGGILSSVWTDMVAGFRYIKEWRGLMCLIGIAMTFKLLLNPAFALRPILVTDHFGGDALQLGFLDSATGIGILAGGITLSIWGGFDRRILTTFAGLVGLGLCLVLLGAIPADGFPIAIVTTFLIGLMLPFVDGPLTAILQASIAPEMQGRVFMTVGSLISSTVPLGLIIAGPVADLVGVRVWFVAAGALTMTMTLVGLFIPSVINIEAERRDGTVTASLAV
jgi:DHA3 family macrolide efflux protein-like MFS transporter